MIAFMGTFFLMGFVMLFYQNKNIPSIKKEEAASSKEFWMFIGTLVLLISAILITVSTSLPIFEAMFSSVLRSSPNILIPI